MTTHLPPALQSVRIDNRREDRDGLILVFCDLPPGTRNVELRSWSCPGCIQPQHWLTLETDTRRSR